MIVNRYLENEVENVTFKVCDAALIPAIADVVERALIVRHKERKFGARLHRALDPGTWEPRRRGHAPA
jgi:hypothetical protein